jgi:hypothetical protein
MLVFAHGPCEVEGQKGRKRLGQQPSYVTLGLARYTYPRAVTTLSPLCRFCFRFVSDEIFVLLRSFRHVASMLLRLEVSVVRFT